MDHWIEHLGEPSRLILTWTALDDSADRRRWAIGELVRTPTGSMFRYFHGEEFARLNAGRSHSQLIAAGYHGYPAFDAMSAQEFRTDALEVFIRRVPSRARPDFDRYLSHFLLHPTPDLRPFSILAATEAGLPSDGFRLVDPLDPAVTHRDLVSEITGHRHHAAGLTLVPGQPLQLEADPYNQWDAKAVRVAVEGHTIGYVNRLQAPTIGQWLKERDIKAWLLRLNGTKAHPRAFAFIQVRPRSERIAA